MCIDPVTATAIVTAAVSAGSAVQQQVGQKKLYESNQVAALVGFRDSVAALADRRDQEGRAAADDAAGVEIAALQERGFANAQSAQFGTGATSAAEILSSISGKRARALDTIGFNRDSTNRQLDREVSSAGAQATSRINSVARPSLTQLGFGLANAALEGGTTYLKYRTQRPGQT